MNNYSYAYPTNRSQIGFAKATTYDNTVGKVTTLPENPMLAMAYVPFQTNFETYDEAKGFKAGTLFPSLDKPFFGSGTR